MNSFEKIEPKLPDSELIGETEPQEESDETDFKKIDLSPAEIKNLGEELEKETGISLSVLERLSKIPRIRKVMAILLLSSGLGFTVLEDAFSQEIKSKKDTEQIDHQAGKTDEANKIEAESPGMKEKFAEIKKKFIDFVKELQEKNVITYNKEAVEKGGYQPAVMGKVGEYTIECLFHHFPYGVEKGKITGGDNERIEITYKDKDGSDYHIGSSFGDFQGYALNYEEREGFRKISGEELVTKYGIILARRDKEGKFFGFAHIKDLSPQEMENIMNDVNRQAAEQLKNQ